jgi:hypothetical protein
VRILVTGSRTWTDRETIAWVLQHWCPCPEISTLVHGAATGADSIAAECGEELGMTVEPHPVKREQWRIAGKRAGHLRNQYMVDLGADLCLAFQVGDSSGTADCVRRAHAAGIRVVHFCYPI